MARRWHPLSIGIKVRCGGYGGDDAGHRCTGDQHENNPINRVPHNSVRLSDLFGRSVFWMTNAWTFVKGAVARVLTCVSRPGLPPGWAA
jgi:hypothetical protein